MDKWTTADIAAYLDVKPATIHAYRSRGQMPPPDGMLGRTPWWYAATIHTWRPREPAHTVDIGS